MMNWEGRNKYTKNHQRGRNVLESTANTIETKQSDREESSQRSNRVSIERNPAGVREVGAKVEASGQDAHCPHVF